MTKLLQRTLHGLSKRLRAALEWPDRDELTRLRKLEHRFVALLDAIADPMVLTDPDGRLRFANRSAASWLRRLTGRELPELVGKPLVDVGLPAEVTRQRIERVNATGTAVTAELSLPNSYGGERWFEVTRSPVFTDGKITAHIAVGRDIDDRRRAQRRLELLGKVSGLVGELDYQELLPAIGKLSLPELADWSSIDVFGAKMMRRSYVAQRDPDRARLAEALQSFHSWEKRQAWHDLAEGRSVLMHDATDELLRDNAESEQHLALLRCIGLRSVMMVPLRVAGTTVAVMTFATAESRRRFSDDDLALAEELARRAAVNIERSQLNAEVEASEARFRTALSSGRTAVFEQDRDLVYRWHYNYSLGVDAVGKTHADLFPPAEAERLTAIKRRVLETGEPAREEIRVTMSGKQAAIALVIDPLRDDSGAIIGIIGSGTDISEEKRVQEELAQAVTFRERLMGILGHDLRNPLSAITAAASLLRRRADLPLPAREHVERINRAATRMNELIGTLLDFTHVRFHGVLPVRPEPTDLADVAHAIVDELRVSEPGRAIELEAHGDAHGNWDRGRLGELLSNLVGNALVHGAPEEPVRVVVDDAVDDVWLRVHNGGAAIAPELKDALFEPFRTGADTPRTRGLGLGLFIVRQIVLAHGGAIDVDSTARDGTTFTVRLPRGTADAAAHAAAH